MSSSTKSRNFRRRDHDDDGDDNSAAPPSSAAKKPPASTQKPKTKSLLSFADDGEEDDFITPARKQKHTPGVSSSSRKPVGIGGSGGGGGGGGGSSHKLTAAKDRLKNKNTTVGGAPSNVTPQAGTYTKEALLELQKNTKTLGGRPPVSSVVAEPVVVLKGVIKPETRGREDKGGVPTEQMAAVGLEDGGKFDDGSLIPDQKMIDAIRAKRERLRQSRAAAPDYISLDGGSHHGEAEGLSDEEPEFQGRIALVGDKKGVFEDVKSMDDGFGSVNGDEIDSEKDVLDDEDEDEKTWELEQFRKGLGKRLDEAPSASKVMTGGFPSVQQVQQKVTHPAPPVVYPSVPSGLSIGGSYGWSGMDVIPLAQQAELSKKALFDNVKRLKESHGRTLLSLNKTDENLSESLLKVTALETALAAAGEKFIFVQKLRDFVTIICDFLQDKAPYIEELEYQMQKLHEDRAAVVIERRKADDNDEMMEIEASVNAAMQVFSKGGSNSSMIEAASNAAILALNALREARNHPVKLDEFGRDVNLQNRMDMTRRAEARQQRRARSESKRLLSMKKDSSYHRIEGESSTDESDSESTAYRSNRDQLLRIAEQIFSDAAEEYSQLSSVKEMFEKWKNDYSSSYRDAYISLSIPAIFSPYVRLELLKWDPLHEDSDFIEMQWYVRSAQISCT